MIIDEEQLINAIKRNAPDWFNRLQNRQIEKRGMITKCLNIARKSDTDDYKDIINNTYNSGTIRLNEAEIILLNYICLIKHKEHVEGEIEKTDSEIQRWLSIITQVLDDPKTVVFSLLSKQAKTIIARYKVKKPPGRPKGSGKRIFAYNDKEYHTIQECADDYGITRQGMFKKLKKLHII